MESATRQQAEEKPLASPPPSSGTKLIRTVSYSASGIALVVGVLVYFDQKYAQQENTYREKEQQLQAEVDTLRNQLSTVHTQPTTVSLTPSAASSPAVTSVTYRNSRFGFTLDLFPGWVGYKAVENDGDSAQGLEGSVTLYMPTRDHAWWGHDPNAPSKEYVPTYTILIYTKAGWQQVKADYEGSPLNFIADNGTRVAAYTYPQDGPADAYSGNVGDSDNFIKAFRFDQ
jgi:hypothetical protein